MRSAAICNSKLVTQYPGWPVGPNIAKAKPPLSCDLPAQSLASQMLHILEQNNGRTLAGAIEPFIPKYTAQSILRAASMAARAYSSTRIGRTVDILSDKKTQSLISSIQEKARILAGSMLIRDIDDPGNTALSGLGIAGAMCSEAKHILWKLPELCPYLTIQEIGSINRIRYLKDNPSELAGLIAERQTRLPDVSLMSNFLAASRQLWQMLKGKSENLLWIMGNCTYHDCHDSRYEESDSAIALAKEADHILSSAAGVAVDEYINHDISNAFGARFFNQKSPFFLGHERYPLFLLRGAGDLKNHMDHYQYVLEVNKYRLDGRLPDYQETRLSGIIKTAIDAAKYRFYPYIPWNFNGPASEEVLSREAENSPAIKTIPMFLEVMLYNLMKNSIKSSVKASELEGQEVVALQPGNISVVARPDIQFSNVSGIFIQDKGQGFNLNSLLRAAQSFAMNPENAKAVRNNPHIFKKVLLWAKKPFSLRSWTVGEILNLAFVARISGFNYEGSSGLGLNEIYEFSRLMGMQTLLTSTADGGALVGLFFGPEKQLNQVIKRELGYNS